MSESRRQRFLRARLGQSTSASVADWVKQNELLSKWNSEVCSGETVPEVEIISLLEEQIPRYKLRADTLTKFGGYENQDWFIPTPALQVDEADLKLSPDQIRETLNYFLLCSNRVSQMTKTYDDIEAVTRLLEEKEKDLELTARIGKELLQQNTKLEKTVETLEAELKLANEKITQLSHEVIKKTELIQILTNDMDDSCLESGMAAGRINLELLQKRIGSLEDENKALKNEYCRLAEDTDDIEARERQLVTDITGQLACANSSMTLLEDELDRQKDENRQQHEQILALTSKLQDTEMRLHKIMTEHEEATSLLQITKDTQNSLALELADFKSRYLEVEALLRETQEQLKKARRRYMPSARSTLFPSLGAMNHTAPFDSLQSELEMSMHSELSADSGFSSGDHVPYFKKVFDTYRCASQNSMSSGDSVNNLNMGIGGCVTSSSGARMSVKPQDSMRRSSGSIYSSSSLGYPSLDSAGQSDNEYFSQTDSDESYPGPPQKGIPGVPGATELEAALKRLTPAEVAARRINLQYGTAFSGYESDPCLPYGCRTPDSLMSTGSANYHRWRLPEKLQIVKPMEGSLTLHQWSQLAQPTFSGLLEERPGVKIRGGKELEEMGVESYLLSDLEEDEEYSNPGKGFESSAPVFTLTNSTVLHPDDGTFLTPSIRSSRVASVCSSIQNSPPQTPMERSRRNSTSTFSTTYGLAKMLNERGIKAVTPSAVTTPCGPNSFTPTATPCNSPDGSPSRCSSPEPGYESFSIPQLILSSVPSFLQQTVGGGAKKKTSLAKRGFSKSGKNEGLVRKIERIGISNLMGNSNVLSLSGSMYSRPTLTSPMAQLTCLLPSNNVIPEENETPVKTEIHPTTSAKPPTGLGVPAKPGTGALNNRIEQLNSRRQRRHGSAGMTRPDLGTVTTNNNPPQAEQSFVGTLSSLLFGRKGGLF